MNAALPRRAVLAPAWVIGLAAAVGAAWWSTTRELLGIADPANATGALIVATFAGLVWMRRFELARLPVRSCAWALVAVAAAALLWLAGNLAFIGALTDLALVAMVAAIVLAVLGPQWARATIFPLAFLLLAVRLWDPLRPPLAALTADVAVAAVRLSGIPIHRQGAFFSIPSGSWSVADECSGTVFLAACLTLGVLYAWLLYRSAWKRLLFVAGALAIGVAGNWLRVYLTVVIAHLSSNRLLREDHYAFGWVLYALLALAYGWLGHRHADAERRAAPAAPDAEPAARIRTTAVAAAALLLLAAGPLVERLLPAAPGVAAPRIGEIGPQNGWSRSAAAPDYRPLLVNATQERIQGFEKDGRNVFVFVGLFTRQSWSAKLVSSVNQLAAAPGWTRAAAGVTNAELAGGALPVHTELLLGPDGRLLAWQWYWLDGTATASGVHAKWRALVARLSGKGDAGMWIAVYTRSDDSVAASSALLAEFLREMGGPLERALRSTAPGPAEAYFGFPSPRTAAAERKRSMN